MKQLFYLVMLFLALSGCANGGSEFPSDDLPKWIESSMTLVFSELEGKNQKISLGESDGVPASVDDLTKLITVFDKHRVNGWVYFATSYNERGSAVIYKGAWSVANSEIVNIDSSISKRWIVNARRMNEGEVVLSISAEIDGAWKSFQFKVNLDKDSLYFKGMFSVLS